MNILFKSHANCTIRLTTKNETVFISPLGSHRISTDEDTLEFTVSPDESSRINYLTKKTGVILKRFFTVCSAYKVTGSENAEINLFTDSKKGKFSDQYNRIAANSTTLTVSPPVYSIFDEYTVRNELNNAKKSTRKTALLFDALDIIGNSFTALLLLLIPFVLIWIFGDFEKAYTICGYIFIPIFAIIVIINRLADKYKRKLWYLLKGKALERNIFKGTDSYFEHEYISHVFRR